MSKLFLGVILLFLWLWIAPEDISWPVSEPDSTAQENLSKTEQAEEAIAASSTTARAVYVIDGDTFDIESGARVRLLGIDTPERGACYYAEATDFVRTLIEGKEVRLVSDETDKDKYDRLLRQVFVVTENGDSEIHLNVRLVEEGYAIILPIPPDRQYREELAAAEAAARAAEKGLWGDCE